jgi:cytoskeletal protein RodZ
MIQNNVARMNAEVVSEPISSSFTSQTLPNLSANPNANETITSATPLAQMPQAQQPNQPSRPSQLNQTPQSAQPIASKPLTQPSVATASKSAVPPTSARSTDANQVAQTTAVNVLSISFTAECWVQAIDKNGTNIAKVFNAGTKLELPINNIKSLVIGNSGAAQAMLGNKKIDLGIYRNPQSSTARLFEKDFASMQ